MKNKYNIALLPLNSQAQITTLAGNFKNIADNYLLGDNSLPHLTLCQFMAEESHIPYLWEKTCDSVENKILKLTFNAFSCITFNNKLFWISLLPDNNDELLGVHKNVLKLIEFPVSKINKDYDPHITLVNTKFDKYKDIARNVYSSYKPISDEFCLSLGKCDAHGQYTEKVYTYDKKSDITLKLR